MMDAVILGASGYGGGELLRLLSGHPLLRSLRGSSRQHAGKPFHTAHPNLRGVVNGAFTAEISFGELAGSEQPVVFAALPHGELAQALPGLEAAWEAAGLAERLLLVDLSGDFRLADPAVFQAAYGRPHPCPERLGSFAYGLPEWNREALRGTRRIASAGCFATALQLALLPLRGLDLGFIAASAATGSSGSGMAPSDTTHHPTRAQDFRAYKVLDHQHLAEVQAMMGRQGIGGRLGFVPQSAPLVRGIFAAVQFALPPGLDAAGLRARAEAAFQGSPFVRMVEGSPRVAAVTGSNFADLGVAAKGGTGCVLAAIDNLVKGMAGQAIQCMNLALGLEEGTGLMQPGCWP
ncbi:MAG: N-acetyl-gamma-glutamyl-phosphate reductase [Acidobacteria bacterium]|nr:N-acetyl-gamma-glutamyl-phosphate reductase [Acidobacteriota bacterium]